MEALTVLEQKVLLLVSKVSELNRQNELLKTENMDLKEKNDDLEEALLLNTEEKRLANAQRHPLKRIGTAEDISNLACFLLSDKSTWMTGQILHLDGGMSVLK